MLAPNWQDHDAKTNPIVNHFADRHHTELIFRKIGKKSKRAVFSEKRIKTVKS